MQNPTSRPDPLSDRRAQPFFWLALLLGAFGAVLYLWSLVLIARHGGVRKDFGWAAARERGAWVVRSVHADGPAAGTLAPGDRILDIAGDPSLDGGLWLHLNPIRPGEPYTLRVASGDAQRQVVLTTRQVREPARLGRIFALLPVGLTFLAIGVLAGVLRPDQKVARLLSLGCLAGALNVLQLVLLVFADQVHGSGRVLLALAALFRPFERVLALHFLLEFPPGLARGRGWTLLLRGLYAWAALLWAGSTTLGFLNVVDPHRAASAAQLYLLGARGAVAMPAGTPMGGSALGLPFFVIANLSILILALWNDRLVRKPDERRRIRWVLAGAVGAFLPVALLDLAAAVARAVGRPELLQTTPFWVVSFLAVWTTILVPVTFGYAVFKHRILAVDRVLRRGLQYLLARNVLRAALLLPGALLLVLIASRPDQGLRTIFTEHPGPLLLIAAAALSLRYRARLSEWLDRRFFRAAYDREHLLLGLIQEIKAHDSLPAIARLVCERLGAALHPEMSLFFHRPPEGRHLEVGYSSSGDWPQARIPESADLLRVMEGQVSAKDVPLTQIDLASDEATWLEQLGVNLIVPIAASDRRLAGLLLLGPKKSEEPYTRTDRRLLEAVAAQVGMVWENAALRKRVDENGRTPREVTAQITAQITAGATNLVRECPECHACYDHAVTVCPADGNAFLLSLPVERTIHGRYRLDRMIGRGGMGAVYEATDLRLTRRVAVKVLVGSLFGNPDALRRFEREARTSAQLRHPAIITVYDYGELAHGGAYLVMELLPGLTLRQEIQQRGTVPPALAASWFDAIFEGVKAAHGAGVIHRDLKPENVLIATDGGEATPRVLDFGLAKMRLSDPEDLGLTSPGTVLGTLSYMSPEQLDGQDVDERTDIFSLGVMVAEALTGIHPFARAKPSEIVSAIRTAPFHLAGGPEVMALDAALQRCIAKDTHERLATVAEMQAVLVPLVARCPPFPAPPPPRAGQTEPTAHDGP